MDYWQQHGRCLAQKNSFKLTSQLISSTFTSKLAPCSNQKKSLTKPQVKPDKTLDNSKPTGLFGKSKAYFRRMEEGDEEALKLWRHCREISIDKYKVSYSRLNVFFDKYSRESAVEPSSVDRAEEILNRKGITECDQGTVISTSKSMEHRNLTWL